MTIIYADAGTSLTCLYTRDVGTNDILEVKKKAKQVQPTISHLCRHFRDVVKMPQIPPNYSTQRSLTDGLRLSALRQCYELLRSRFVFACFISPWQVYFMQPKPRL